MQLIAIACLLLSAAMGWWIFTAPEAPPAARERELRIAAWRERKLAIYQNLKDLHFEYRAGKLSGPDFERTRAMLEREAAAAVTALEQAEAADPAASAAGGLRP